MRPMRWWDIEAVMRLERELFADEAWTEAMFWSELAERATRRYLVTEDGPALTGYAGLCSYAPHEAYIQTIAVAPAAQRNGVGTALLVCLLEEAEKLGATHVDLEVKADNEVAQRLYERHGFVRLAVRKRYYQPSGTDAIVMRRELAA
jgi:[ribosomal protein S18]-alanine N-acetyltransferase